MDDETQSIIFGNFAIIISFSLLTSHGNFIVNSPAQRINEEGPVDANNM
jgi:hypothetical protein